MEKDINIVEVECPAKKAIYKVSSSIFMLIGALGFALMILINFISFLEQGIGGLVDFILGNIFNALYLVFLLSIYLKAKEKSPLFKESFDSLRILIKVIYIIMMIAFGLAVFGLLIMIPTWNFVSSIAIQMAPEYEEILKMVTTPILLFALAVIAFEIVMAVLIYGNSVKLLNGTYKTIEENKDHITPKIEVISISLFVYGGIYFIYTLYNLITQTFKLSDASLLINDISLVNLVQYALMIYFGVLLLMFKKEFKLQKNKGDNNEKN